MTSRLPPLLRPGSRVCVVSPSGPVTPENLAPGLKALREWGLDVTLDGSVYDRSPPGYFAGDDNVRASAINRALHGNFDAVVFSRGGYGLTRIVDRIDFQALSRSPRWVVGFSDVTAFHLAARSESPEVATLHGHVVKSFSSQAGDLPKLHKALFEGVFEVHPLERISGAGEAIEGTLCGGNAALVAAMLGDPLMPDLTGHILFLEDVGEADYRLDRLFQSIARSSQTRSVRAVILGDFTDCAGVYVSDNDFPQFLEHLAGELAERIGCPVFAGLPAGHGARNAPIPCGLKARIDSQNRLSVVCE